MEDKKYYWMSFEMGDMIIDSAVTEHPFIVITKLRRNPSYGALLNWRHISEEDYILFNDILFNITKYVDDKPED
jgi:hypothetical protein